MSPPTNTAPWVVLPDTPLEAGWWLAWAIGPNGEHWPVIADTHLDGPQPLLIGPALNAAAAHEVV